MNSFPFTGMQLNFINLGNKLDCAKNIRKGLLEVFPRDAISVEAHLESQLAYASAFVFVLI